MFVTHLKVGLLHPQKYLVEDDVPTHAFEVPQHIACVPILGVAFLVGARDVAPSVGMLSPS